MRHSLGGVGHDYRGCCGENPRTMRVIHYARDVLINHFEASDGMRFPLAPVLAQRDDCQLAVQLLASAILHDTAWRS